MKRRAFLLGLIAAPAAPLAVRWMQPKPDYGRALAASMMETKWVRQATMYGGLLVENVTQAHAREIVARYRAMYPRTTRLWEDA